MPDPIAQAQDHDRRIGRLEGMAELLDRRLDGIEKRIDSVECAMDACRDFGWLIGSQLTTLLGVGTLSLSRLPG